MIKNKGITIITPMYNSELYIAETAKSVINQSYGNWEWLVIDDASSDNSVSVLEKIVLNDRRVKIIKKTKNTGQANSRNIGLKNANNEIITFLDSDDIWNEKFLEKQLKFLEKTNSKIVTAGFQRMDKNLKNILKINVPIKEITFNSLLKNCDFSCLTTVFYKLDNYYFDESMEALEDYLFWLNLLKIYKIGYGNTEILGSYRIHNKTVSSNKIKNIKWLIEVYHKKLKINIFFSFILILRFIIKNVIKNKETLFYLIKYNIKKYKGEKKC